MNSSRTLSPREMILLRTMADGLTNKEVSERLHISEKTVKAHTSNIFNKLGVSNRTAAVAMAFQLGWFACGRLHQGSDEDATMGDPSRPSERQERDRIMREG